MILEQREFSVEAESKRVFMKILKGLVIVGLLFVALVALEFIGSLLV